MHELSKMSSKFCGLLPLAGLLIFLPGGVGSPSHSSGQGQRIAFLVGVSKYQNKPFKDLTSVPSEIRDLRTTLIESGLEDKNIVDVSGDSYITKKMILDKLRLLCQPSESGSDTVSPSLTPDDTLLITLNGHGIERKEKNEPFTYCPSNAKIQELKSRLTIDEILNELKVKDPISGQSTFIVKRILIIVDSCRDDPENDGKGGEEEFSRESNFESRQGVSTLFACTAGQRSLIDEKSKRSFFLDAVLQGLAGGAGSDANEEISLLQFVNYVTSETTKRAKHNKGVAQVPKFVPDPASDGVANWPIVPTRKVAHFHNVLPKNFETKTDWSNCCFVDIDFSPLSVIKRKRLSSCKFVRCNFAGLGFMEKTLVRDVEFIDCQLSNADFAGAVGTKSIVFLGKNTVDRNFNRSDRWPGGKPESLPAPASD